MKEKRHYNIESKGFLVIEFPDSKNRVSVSRPNTKGQILMNLSFSLAGKMPMADEIDRLPYINVDEVHSVDDDYSYIVMSSRLESNAELQERLVEDLPRIFDNYVEEDER